MKRFGRAVDDMYGTDEHHVIGYSTADLVSCATWGDWANA
jgi:hypothetical protein